MTRTPALSAWIDEVSTQMGQLSVPQRTVLAMWSFGMVLAQACCIPSVAAVLAGLTLPWSNGPLEGHVNRLKLIKRSMYGRAEFDLLKLRVLYQSQKSKERKDKRKDRQEQPARHLTTLEMIKRDTNSFSSATMMNEVA